VSKLKRAPHYTQQETDEILRLYKAACTDAYRNAKKLLLDGLMFENAMGHSESMWGEAMCAAVFRFKKPGELVERSAPGPIAAALEAQVSPGSGDERPKHEPFSATEFCE